MRWERPFRITGLCIIILSILAIEDYNPFRGSLFTPYDGNQGIAPYQEVVNYVNERGGLCFWNYLEAGTIERQELFDYGVIRGLIADHMASRRDTSWQLWNLIVYQHWHGRYMA